MCFCNHSVCRGIVVSVGIVIDTDFLSTRQSDGVAQADPSPGVAVSVFFLRGGYRYRCAPETVHALVQFAAEVKMRGAKADTSPTFKTSSQAVSR
jgi:hypothetical protein